MKITRESYKGMKYLDEILGEDAYPVKLTILENRDNGQKVYEKLYQMGHGQKYPLIQEYMGYLPEDELLMGDTQDMPLDSLNEGVFGFTDQDKPFLSQRGSWEAIIKSPAGHEWVSESVSDITLGDFMERYDPNIISFFFSLKDYYPDIIPIIHVRQKGSKTDILTYTANYGMHRILDRNFPEPQALGEKAMSTPRFWGYSQGGKKFIAEFDESHDDSHIRQEIEKVKHFSPRAFHTREEMINHMRH